MNANERKHTPGEAAWAKFSSAPLIAAIGANRASFFAGYQTAEDALLAERDRLKAENAELLAALRSLEKFVTDLSEQSDANAAEYLHRVRREHVSQVMTARAALAKRG